MARDLLSCHRQKTWHSFIRRGFVTFWKSIDDRLVTLFGRLIDALCDPMRRHRVALTACLAYAVMWALYAVIAKSSQGINADLGEMVVWSRNLGWGFPKHPPFPALVLAGWFAIFPEADWAYYLLSGLNSGLACIFHFCWRVSGWKTRSWLPRHSCSRLIPFYNFLGLKFDQNSILIPLWALTTWAFVLSFRRCHLGYATLAGVAAAACCPHQILVDLPRARARDCRARRSAAPDLFPLHRTLGDGLSSGALLIAPHLVWLVRENFPPLQWMGAARGGQHGRQPDVAPGISGIHARPMRLWRSWHFLWRVHPPAAAWRDMIFPREPQRRMAVLISLPLLLPIVVAMASQRTLLSLWNTPSMGLLPVVLMSSPLVVAGRIAAIRIAGFAVTFSLLALLASPIVAAVKLVTGVENDASYVPAVAAAVEREWNSQTDRPLEILAGPFGLTSSVAFTLKDRPSTYANFRALSFAVGQCRGAHAQRPRGGLSGPRCGLHGASCNS